MEFIPRHCMLRYIHLRVLKCSRAPESLEHLERGKGPIFCAEFQLGEVFSNLQWTWDSLIEYICVLSSCLIMILAYSSCSTLISTKILQITIFSYFLFCLLVSEFTFIGLFLNSRWLCCSDFMCLFVLLDQKIILIFRHHLFYPLCGFPYSKCELQWGKNPEVYVIFFNFRKLFVDEFLMTIFTISTLHHGQEKIHNWEYYRCSF